jgi:dihydrofolate reductase
MTGTRIDKGRRVVVAEFVTLDGFIVGPDEDMSWVIGAFDPRMQEDIAQDMGGSYDLFVFGRVTYGIFADYWPDAVPYDDGDRLDPAGGKEDPRIIRSLNEEAKLVFSTTLGQPGWPGTRVVGGGVEDEVRRLKAEPGSAMLVQGSASVVQALARADLVDEYRLYLHPVLLGAGTPLFGSGHARQDLDLVRTVQYANGVIATTYERREAAR